MFTDLIPSFGNSWFEDVFKDFDTLMKMPSADWSSSFPPINVYLDSSSNGFYLEMSLVGYKKDWLSVEAEGTQLVVRADVPEVEEDESKKYFKRRIQARSFEKKYKVTEDLDVSKTEVTFESGLLTIFIPTKEKIEPTTKKFLIN